MILLLKVEQGDYKLIDNLKNTFANPALSSTANTWKNSNDFLNYKTHTVNSSHLSGSTIC